MREEEKAKVRVNAIIGHGEAVPSLRPSRDPKDQEVFSHFVLNKDPEASKYMPYDSVAYPKITRAKPGRRPRPRTTRSGCRASWTTSRRTRPAS